MFNTDQPSIQWTKHPLYQTFNSMKYRCYNPDAANYHLYGGRGIRICDEWLRNKNSFFIWAINNGWTLGLCIDRINNNGNYEPSNCQFVTRSTNSRKDKIGRPNLRNIYHNGEVIGKWLW
jgi:hypothetical protein